MNQNLGILDEDHNPKHPQLGDSHDQLLPESCVEGEIRRKPPNPLSQEYYRGYDNNTDFYRPLILPLLSHGHSSW